MKMHNLTFEAAAVEVMESTGDIFSRDAVMNILARVQMGEEDKHKQRKSELMDQNLYRAFLEDDLVGAKVLDMILTADINDMIDQWIENNWNDLVDWESAEFAIQNGNEIELTNVDYSGRYVDMRSLCDDIKLEIQQTLKVKFENELEEMMIRERLETEQETENNEEAILSTSEELSNDEQLNSHNDDN